MSAEPRHFAFPQDDTGTIRHLRPNNLVQAPEQVETSPEPENPPQPKTEDVVEKQGLTAIREKLSDKRVLLAGGAAGAFIMLLTGWWAFHSTSPVMQQAGQEVGMVASPQSRPVPKKIQSAAPPQSQDIPTPQASDSIQHAAPFDDLSAMLAVGPRHKSPENSNQASPPVPSPSGLQAARTHAEAPPESLTPQTAAETARHLVAAPMSPKDQVDVLQLVTMEAALVQNTRTEIAALRKELQLERDEAQKARADFLRRLALLEARKAVADATDLPNTAREDAADQAKRALAAAMAQPERPPSPSSAGPLAHTQQAQTLPVAPRPPHNWIPHYRIVSASPLLGMVQDDNAPAGEQSQLEVEPGTNLRGYGIVKSIYQVGTNWVIKTDHGLIN